MAMMASKSAYTPSLMSATQSSAATSSSHPVITRRVLAPMNANQTLVTSPTDSEFSDVYDSTDAVRSWDEKAVADWLRTINCGQYEPLFKANHFNGDNLLECDQAVLKELGIKKIGDRVRIFVAVKSLRTQAFGKQRKRNRDSFAALDNPSYTPPSSASPRPSGGARDRTQATASTRRYSRPIDNYNLGSAGSYGKSSSRPDSPLVEGEGVYKAQRSQRYAGMSPMESSRWEHGNGYFSNPSSASTTTGRAPEPPLSARQAAHNRNNPSVDKSTMGPLPSKMQIVRVIYSAGETRVVKPTNFKSAEDIMRSTLKGFRLPEAHVKNYCFYVLDGLEPDPAHCRRLSDQELVRICSDPARSERNRLILRKIHAGEPGDDELQRAAELAQKERDVNLQYDIAKTNSRSQLKIQRLTGEPWETIKNPKSPTSAISPGERMRNVYSAAKDLERPEYPEALKSGPRQPSHLRQIPSFLGQRPPSELISSDLTTYFPDHQKEDIEKTVRMSMRRSARLSRATSRLSTASNLSTYSNLKDAPPMPSVPDTWLRDANQTSRHPRPLSSSRIGGQQSYRDSVASSTLGTLREESPLEPDRKSYVSFDSSSDSAVQITDPDGNVSRSYYDESASSTPDLEGTGSLNETLGQFLAEDGEEQDEELSQFIAGESWDHIKWMKGALIGQGSFGSVYLALHSITGVLMAVKQVEMPSNEGSIMDNKKRGMVDALKREIGLLKSFQHPNIVQYLGSSSDEEHLNIFLEYVPGGSVAQMLNSYGPQNETLIANFVRQILTGLQYLHEREIIHRDIKGANVLVDNKGCVKISDFGISKRVEASTLLNKGAGHANRPSLQGSVFWMAPEVVKQTSYTRKADIWSLGCLVVEMFTGNHPYPDCSQLQAIFKIGNSKASPTLPENASEAAKTFLGQTFEIDHNKRPDASELLDSRFLKPST